nr:HAD-IIIC family phosphatase [Catenulispora rubra]
MTTKIIKCLVWDLDNTLWQGTLLEDGDVQLADEIRRTVVGLDQRGILQSIASRNDPDHAWNTLEKLGLSEYFILPRIGWGRKSDSITEIIAGLGFAEHAIAFIDDQPFERAEVAHFHPEVHCYGADQAPTLLDLPEFSPPVVTADSRQRRSMYQARFQRDAEQASYQGPDEEFLRSLEMVMTIARATESDLDRVEELTLRTSQMNATGIHYSAETLQSFIADPDHEVLVVTLTDKFGPHGAIGVILLERRPQALRIRLLATSCRVVAYGVGAALLRWLTDQAHHTGVHLNADFRTTARNRMMEIAYRFAGLKTEQCACLTGTETTQAPADAEEITHLHLVPTAQPQTSTMRIDAVDLALR